MSFGALANAAEPLPDPPPDFAKRVAHRETLTAAERLQYAYTQSFRLEEFNPKGGGGGAYSEVREVIFSPSGERTERFKSQPVSHLKNLILTAEDFADIREIQPFVMTEDQLWIYKTEYKGEEEIDGRACWVLSISPRQILAGAAAFRRPAVDFAGRFFGDSQRRQSGAPDHLVEAGEPVSALHHRAPSGERLLVSLAHHGGRYARIPLRAHTRKAHHPL